MALSIDLFTTHAPVPHKACVVGFALQTAKGVHATSPSLILPINEEFDFGVDQKLTFFQFADGRMSGPRHYFVAGYNTAGTIKMPLYPGMLSGISGMNGGILTSTTPTGTLADIGRWMLGRESVIYGGAQGLWATIFVYTGHTRLRFGDVKVETVKIAVSYGQMVTLELSVVGIAEPKAWTEAGSPKYVSDTLLPYMYKDCSIALGGVSDHSTQDHTLTFENALSSVDDAATLTGSITPLYLPNGELAKVTGTFTRHFLDSTVYTAFLNRTAVSYTLSGDNGASCTFSLSLTRCIYTAAPLKLPNSGFLKQEGIEFQALADGASHPWTIMESVP